MNLTLSELVAEIEEAAVRDLCLSLLYKRENDGLNGRAWDAGKHAIWECRINDILKLHNCLGHCSL